MGILLISASVITAMSESMLIKKYNSKHESGGYFFTAVVSLFSMLFFLFSDKGGFIVPEGMLPYAVSSGICYLTASFLTYMAIQWGPYAISMLLLSYSGILISTVYGVICLDEKITPLMAGGLAVVLVSVYLSRSRSTGDEKKASLKWVIAIAVSCAGSGLFSVIKKMQQVRFAGECDHEFMVISLAISAVVLFVIEAVRVRNVKKLPFACIPYAAGAGISNGLTNLIMLIVYNIMPMSVLSPVRSGVQIVLYYVLGIFVWKEKYEKRQLVGAALGLLAVLLLNI